MFALSLASGQHAFLRTLQVNLKKEQISRKAL